MLNKVLDSKTATVLTLAGIAILCVLALVGRGHAEVSYHEYHGTTYGSDGSQSRVYNGDTYIKDRSGHETRCHTFASRTTCR